MNEDTYRASETEVSPELPTSGQILGELVKSLGIDHPMLNSGTARNYFSGRLSKKVKESTRGEIIKAIAETVAQQGMAAGTSAGEDSSSISQVLTTIIDSLAVKWDRMRIFLRPRTMRVYPSHLPAVWLIYVRLVGIDLAIRVAAQMCISGARLTALDPLEWVGVDHRGRYLNKMRAEAGFTSLSNFAEELRVDINTVEAWVYRGSRPHSKNLRAIAKVLAKPGDSHNRSQMLRELRRLYWASDLAAVLGNHIGTEAVTDIVQHLKGYAVLVYGILEDEARHAALADIIALGAGSRFSEPLLNTLANSESNDEWKENIMAARSDWIRRILTVNHQVHQAEVDDLLQKSDGGLLRDWDISSPEAYAHYRRSEELQAQGKTHEALAEVAKAAELDPMDPANHFTLGSVKGGMGFRTGNAALMTEGLEECWLAAKLDPSWILPWTEVGWILLMVGRAEEAVEHLMSISPDRGEPDSYYIQALGISLRHTGSLEESLEAFEAASKLNPDDPHVAIDTAFAALLLEKTAKASHYSKIATYLGFSDEVKVLPELVKLVKTGLPLMDQKHDTYRRIYALDASLRRNPNSASTYLLRARVYFEKE